MLTIESQPVTDWLKFFLSARAYLYIRFGMWEDVTHP